MTMLLKQRAAKLQLKVVLQQLAIRALSTTSARCAADETTKPSEHYDIIIGGGGLVGTTLACALAKSMSLAEKRVLLLEGAPAFKGYNVEEQYGNRVSAINKGSIELFKKLSAWQRMVAARVKPVKQMQVWDASSDALIQFHHEHYAADVACIVENDLMLDAMYKELEACENSNVVVRNQARIKSVQLPAAASGGTRSEVQLQGGETYSCDLLIGADGANSLVRQAMNVDVYAINYERMGLVATLELCAAGDNAVAWQRFIPSGPVAMLPLTDTMSSLVWSTSNAHAKELAAMPETEFVDALNEAFCKEYASQNDLAVTAVRALNSLMGRNASQSHQFPPKVCGVVAKSRATFPLGFLHAASYVGAGVALIGDAAHRVHPLAGQGVNLGYSDVRHLVAVLEEAAYAGAKLGDKQYLIKYEQRCLSNNVPILIGVHGMQSMYSTTFSPVVLLRSLGLQLTHNIPQIKQMFMKRALG